MTPQSSHSKTGLSKPALEFKEAYSLDEIKSAADWYRPIKAWADSASDPPIETFPRIVSSQEIPRLALDSMALDVQGEVRLGDENDHRQGDELIGFHKGTLAWDGVMEQTRSHIRARSSECAVVEMPSLREVLDHYAKEKGSEMKIGGNGWER